MEKELIGENELNALKKKNTGLIVFFILWTLLIAGWITLVFLLQNRSTEYLWLYLGAIVTTLLIVVLLYVFTKWRPRYGPI
jgi:tetrahydromethanopterin S-methyltransferase subunit E